ncbi:hypothetical protein C0J52_19138 [Blattella germanica]|nr:hypothetical protein C0J52_19138 [Blattella germanica]
MAEDSGNEDQWLYGDSNQDPPEDEVKIDQKTNIIEETPEISQQDEISVESEQLPVPEPPTIIAPPIESEDGQLSGGEEQVPPGEVPMVEEADYFNYGFNEETWRAYCERQKRIRIHESGVGLAQIGGQATGRGTIPVAITNDNSKYSGFMGPKKAGPPPGRKMGGTIDVMTADRREYSRKPAFPDMSVPPPTAGITSFDLPPPPHGVIPTSFSSHVDSYGPEFYGTESDPYYHSYEPTQDSQWNDPTWQPTTMSATDLKVVSPLVTPLPPVIPPPSLDTSNQDSQDAFSSRGSVREHSEDVNASGSGVKEEKDEQSTISEKETRERTKDRSERSEKSERHRDRHRHRSRSRSTERRSRRHKSRSRSPGHRSHRKKKSRRSDREKSKEESE